MAKDNRKGRYQKAGARKPQGGFSPLLFVALGALLVLAAGVLLVLRPGITGSAAAGDGPRTAAKLVVDREEIDFGPVKFEKVVKATFKLSNGGDEPLQIIGTPQVEVREGC